MVNQITIASFIAGSCIGVDHNCSQLCTRVSEAFVCRCFHGYKLARDGRTCFDINECMEYRPCHQLCRNTNGSFECACLDGYSLDKVSNTCIGKLDLEYGFTVCREDNCQLSIVQSVKLCSIFQYLQSFLCSPAVGLEV